MAGGFQAGAFDNAFSTTYSGFLDVTEAKDQASFTADIRTLASFQTTEPKDQASFTVAGATLASINAMEGKDVAAFTISSVTQAQVNVSEAGDTADFTATLEDTLFAELAVTEGIDEAYFEVLSRNIIEFDIVEPADIATFSTTATTFASFDIQELPDTPRFRGMAAFFGEGDALTVRVPFELQATSVPRQADRGAIATENVRGYIPNENQTIEVR